MKKMFAEVFPQEEDLPNFAPRLSRELCSVALRASQCHAVHSPHHLCEMTYVK